MTESPSEPQMDPSLVPPKESRRGSSLTLPLIVLIFAAGLWAGYGGRPYVERLLVTRLPSSVAVVSSGPPVAVAMVTNGAPSATVPAATASVTGTGATSQTIGPVLITPTPDRSGEINQYILAKVKHFQGDPKAPVVMIEFSDFQ